jgi:hypothetical protein
MLTGHNLGLKSRYAKPTATDLLEGNDKSLGYIAAIDALTINEENRLKIKVAELTHKSDRFDSLEEKIQMLNKKLGLDW